MQPKPVRNDPRKIVLLSFIISVKSKEKNISDPFPGITMLKSAGFNKGKDEAESTLPTEKNALRFFSTSRKIKNTEIVIPKKMNKSIRIILLRNC